MKKITVTMIMQFDRKIDDDLYNDYSPLSLLLASSQGDNSDAVLDTIQEIESTMNAGKIYRITIEEL